MDRQLRKGLIEFCVLAAIREEDSYGYKMIEDILNFGIYAVSYIKTIGGGRESIFL